MHTTIDLPDKPSADQIDDETGLPVVSSKRAISSEDVKSLEDEP
jgi:hypothetical protein